MSETRSWPRWRALQVVKGKGNRVLKITADVRRQLLRKHILSLGRQNLGMEGVLANSSYKCVTSKD